MRQTLLIIATFALLLYACNKNKEISNPNGTVKTIGHTRSRMAFSGPYSQFIPIDSANKMLLSYLNSIAYNQNDSDLQCLIFNSDSIRKYLSDTTIKSIKIMFAHHLDYINRGGNGINCGYQSGEFTVILAGYNSVGNYVYHNQNNTLGVLEMAMPCPNGCPSSGTASSPLLSN